MFSEPETDSPEDYFELTQKVLKAAFEVHSKYGPGLLERAYQACLKDELTRAGFRVDSEISVPIVYKNRLVDKAYVIDLLVDKKLIIELKSVEKVQQVHRQQLKTYLKFSDMPVGLLLNFNSVHLKDGIMRVNNDISAKRKTR